MYNWREKNLQLKIFYKNDLYVLIGSSKEQRTFLSLYFNLNSHFQENAEINRVKKPYLPSFITITRINEAQSAQDIISSNIHFSDNVPQQSFASTSKQSCDTIIQNTAPIEFSVQYFASFFFS